DRLDLAEERPEARERVVAPVVEQARGLRRHAGRAQTPLIDVPAQLVDDRRRVVLLLGRGDAGALVEHQGLLRSRGLPLLRLRDRGNELGRPPKFHQMAGRLALLVELPVPPRVFVRRVEDRLFEELLGWDELALPGFIDWRGSKA